MGRLGKGLEKALDLLKEHHDQINGEREDGGEPGFLVQGTIRH